jgi:glutaredoxin
MIEIYSRPTCSRCEKVKNELEKRNIEYTEHIIEQTITREEVVKKFPGVSQLPIVVLDGTHIGGRDEALKMINEGTLS